jgi:hypothetical protein
MSRLTISTKKTFKLGRHRGKFRVWIEGKFLLNAGLSAGMRFNTVFISGYGLRLEFKENGQRKISGSAARPIIDINAKYLEEMFTDDENIHATHYIATIYHASSFEENSRTLYIEGEWQ